MSSSSAPSTLLSALHSATVLDGLRNTENAHPFSDSYASTVASLRSLVSTTEQLNQSIAQLSTVPPNDPKLLSLLRQQTGFDYPRNQASSTATNFASIAKNRPLFPEPIPFSSDGKLPIDYVLARIAQWGTSLKMETFTERASSQKATVLLGGKVILVDVELDAVAVAVVSVKTSFALNGEHTTESSPTLERFLSRSIGTWIEVVRRAVDVNQVLGADEEDPAMLASRLHDAIQAHFKYILTLDSLAANTTNGGIRWFTDSERIREAVDKQVSADLPPDPTLDILLTRKPVPLNCVVSPALSFLLWLSPRAYLFLLRNTPSGKAPAQEPLGDIPRNQLMSSLVDSSGQILEGATVATLRLVLKQPGEDSVLAMSTQAIDGALPEAPLHQWILDFTDNSLRRRLSLGNFRLQKEPRGVVMSQSRMRALERALRDSGDPTHSIDMGIGMHSNFNMGFNGPSWLDVLLQGGPNCPYSERYTATYRSSSGPAAKLRLNSPFEPGFLLQRVPVRRISDIPKILEVVKEQWWLNEALLSVDWVPENSQPQLQSDANGDDAEGATPDMLDALLSGSFEPKSIVINVFLPKSPFHPFAQPVASPEPIGDDLEALAHAGDSANKSLFGDVDMDMEIPGLSMGSMGGGLGGAMSGDLDGGMGGMDLGGLDLGMSGGPTAGEDSGIATHAQPVQPEGRPVPAIAMAIPMRSGGTTDVRVSFVGGGSAGTGNQAAGSGNANEGTSTGVRVEIAGTTSLEPATLEEVVRRGGIWSLPGRVRASHK